MGTKRPTTDEADRNLLADIARAKAEHTPGPWKIHTPSEFYDTIPDNANFQIEFGPGDWGGFWIVEHSGIDRRCEGIVHTNPMNDAHLIAAAPDLLAACKALDSAWASKSPLAWQPDGHADLLEALRAAIAKAEGNPTT